MFKKYGAAGAERFVTDYTNSCLEKVDHAYGELADYLTFKCLYSYSDAAPPKLPGVSAPAVPTPPGN